MDPAPVFIDATADAPLSDDAIAALAGLLLMLAEEDDEEDTEDQQ